jgi:hypothetical protein
MTGVLISVANADPTRSPCRSALAREGICSDAAVLPAKNPELLFPSIANIVTNAVLFARANPDDGDIDYPDEDLPAMSINMTILLTLIVSFSIALAGVVHI